MSRPFDIVAGLTVLAAGVMVTQYDATDVLRMQDDLAGLHEGLGQGKVVVPPAEVEEGPGLVVVDLLDGTTEPEMERLAERVGVKLSWVHKEAADEGLTWARVDDVPAALAAFEGEALVEVAEPIVEFHIPTEVAGDDSGHVGRAPRWNEPNDPLYSEQWNLPAMGAPAGWANTPAGEGVIVAVVDTGVTRVEDLAGTEILEGASFVAGMPDWADDNGHGTHVAGTIAQTTNNGLGVAGVAPSAKILPVKVLSGFGGGTSAGVAAGIDWAVDQGADVINLSLGSAMPSVVVATAVTKARAAGVIVVAAAGNDGRGAVSWPGAMKEAIGVGATGPDGTLAPYSNYGLGVDIVAPGGDKRKPGGGILQDTISGTGHAYTSYQGTSMAAPHVTGAAAVLLSTGFLDAGDVEKLLLAGADGRIWTPRQGWGRLDLERSIGLIGGTERGERFLLGAAFAGVAATLSAGFGFRLLSVLSGAWAAGGLFFLAPMAGMWASTASRGLLSWPVVWMGPVTGQLPAWLGGLIAVAIAFVLGPFKWTRPLALGMCAGISAHLVHAMATGSMVPWFLTGTMANMWLAGNAAVAALAAVALAGTDHLARKHGVHR